MPNRPGVLQSSAIALARPRIDVETGERNLPRVTSASPA